MARKLNNSPLRGDLSEDAFPPSAGGTTGLFCRGGDHPRPRRVSAVLAPVLTPYDPIKQNLDEMLSAPSFKHPLGTDRYGRDVLTRIIYGCRYALIIGVGVVAIQLLGRRDPGPDRGILRGGRSKP